MKCIHITFNFFHTLKNGNNRSCPLQTSGFGGLGVGGAVWWSNIAVLPIKRGKK